MPKILSISFILSFGFLLNAEAKLITTFTNANGQLAPLADATTDGKYIVVGCGEYKLSRKTTAKVCHPSTDQLKIYNVEKDTFTPIVLNKRPSDDIDYPAAVYDIYSQSLFLAEYPALDGDEFKELPTQEIHRVDLKTGRSERFQSLQAGQICTQIKALRTGLLCSMAKYIKNENGEIQQEGTDLVILEYFTGKSLLNKVIAKTVDAFPDLGKIDLNGPSLFFEEDLGGGLYSAQKSFLFDPTNLNFQYIDDIFPTRKGSLASLVTEVGQRVTAQGVKLFYLFYSDRFSTNEAEQPKLFIVNDKLQGSQKYELPLDAKTTNALGISQSGDFIYQDLKTFAVFVLALDGTPKKVASYEKENHVYWSQTTNQLVAVNCRAKANEKYDCKLETLNPDTGAKTQLALPPNYLPKEVTRDKENLFIVISGNTYLYRFADGKNHLLIDREIEFNTFFGRSRLISDLQVLALVGIYNDHDEMTGADLHLIDIDSAK